MRTRMIALITLCLTILVLLAGFGAASMASTPSDADFGEVSLGSITVSGSITGPSGPVEGVRVMVNSFIDVQEDTTDGSGNYSVSIQANDLLLFHVRPQFSDRLAQINYRLDGVTGNVIQDFTLVDGYLLSLEVTDAGAVVDTESLSIELLGLIKKPVENYWLFLEHNPVSNRHEAVLAPDIYYVTVDDRQAGTYQTIQPFDLRTTDQPSATMVLNDSYVHPIPYDPPDASKITIDPSDDLGEAMVTGAPGAALPLAQVLLVNLNSTHQSSAISEDDGSFNARIYAPPGSAIQIKHGPASYRWATVDVGIAEGVNPFPGTTIYTPFNYDDGDPGTQSFATTGLIEGKADDIGETPNYVGAAWAMTGTLKHVTFDGEWTRVLSGTYENQAIHGLYLGGMNWTHPALGDLDDDGDLDLLMGERSGTLVLFRNLTETDTPDWQYESGGYAGVNAGEGARPALADVTDDGALDLFVGRGDGQVDIYINQGTASSPVWPDSPDETLVAAPPAAPALANLDGDEDLDLLVGHGGGTLFHFANEGSVSEPDWQLVTNAYSTITETGNSLQPSFINLDGDDDLDLLIGRNTDLVWYRNDGSHDWQRMSDNYLGLQTSSALSPGVGDWDNDLDLDLITGEHWGVPLFFRNDGPPSWTEQSYSWPLDLSGDSAPALADFANDDGLPDLLLGQVHGSIIRYDNDGTAGNPNWFYGDEAAHIDGPNHPHAFPALADLNNDDKIDLVAGYGGWEEGTGAGGTLLYYENKGSFAEPDWTEVITNYAGVDVGGWSAPAFADIDDNGTPDLFIGNEEGYITFIHNVGSPAVPDWAPPEPLVDIDFGDYASPSFFDLDGDDDLDLLIGLGDGTLTHLENVGSPAEAEWKLAAEFYQGIDVGRHAKPAAADLNGDSLPDLVLGGEDGGLRLYLYAGPGSPEPADPALFQPGDLIKVEGVLKLQSQAITATTNAGDIFVHGGFDLQRLFNADGNPQAGMNYFMSTMLTPSGFPIQSGGFSTISLNRGYAVNEFNYAGGNTLAKDFNFTIQLPMDLEAGIYRPVMSVHANGVPTATQWLAAYVNNFLVPSEFAPLAPIQVGEPDSPRMIWRLLMDDFVQGTRGAAAREDEGLFDVASQIVTQGAPYYVPPVDVRTGQPITYRLEPFLPMLSFSERRIPGRPLLPLDLPSGELCVTIHLPDGGEQDLGCEILTQSFNRTKTNRYGSDLNIGTTQLDDVYSLMTAGDSFRIAFEQYGHHLVEMRGNVDDPWGNIYAGGGTYDLWVAHPLDIDAGVLPGTPLTVGDAFNPAMQFYPRVPADVRLTVTHFPDSNPDFKEVYTVTGQADDFGYFSSAGPAIVLDSPGEFRVDARATYTDPDGIQYMGSMTWGSIVATPDDQAQLRAHGRRGLDSLVNIPSHWFNLNTLPIPPGSISHAFNAYYNGDILWSRMSDGPYGGDSLLIVGTVQDTIGEIESAMIPRLNRMNSEVPSPGDVVERFQKGELPLFSSTYSGRPVQLSLGQVESQLPGDVDQLAYAYRSSQRPGVRVREIVSEDNQNGGYWRLDTFYDDQLGVGLLGDQTNDFKFQYVGAVYRDLETGHNEYLAQGSGWIFIPDSDVRGSRLMPPFAGPGNGGWTTEGGPILTLKGQDIHMFILPTGVKPGAVLEEGDIFHFGGHIMPTLNSQVAVTITAPGGTAYHVDGQANKIGYFYNPAADFAVDEPGLWTVDVRIWHDDQIGTGQSVNCDPADPFDPALPCPTGDVLGSAQGRYTFYVVPAGTDPLALISPSSVFLSFSDSVTPITIKGWIPGDMRDVTVDYTIGMPGVILDQGQASVSGGAYSFTYNPAALNQDFPNLDLIGRDKYGPGLADTVAIGLLLQGDDGSKKVYRAATVTLQGEQVFVLNTDLINFIYLPHTTN